MDQGAVAIGPKFALVLAGLVAVAAAAALIGRIGVGRAVTTAALRAVLQLGVVSLLITGVLRSWWTTAAFIALMLGVAVATSARRVSTLRLGWPAALPIAAGAIPVGASIVAAGTMPLVTVAVLPIAGILIGGAMTATSLAGRRALDELAIAAALTGVVLGIAAHVIGVARVWTGVHYPGDVLAGAMIGGLAAAEVLAWSLVRVTAQVDVQQSFRIPPRS
jgi:ABC-type iron transport system FetAB permease component